MTDTPRDPLTDDVPVVAYTEDDLSYWRKRVARTGPVDVPADTPWPDADVLLIIGRFLATLDARPSGDEALPSITELAGALYETDPPESWMRTGTDEYRKRADAMREFIREDRAALAAPVSPSPDVEGLTRERDALADDEQSAFESYEALRKTAQAFLDADDAYVDADAALRAAAQAVVDQLGSRLDGQWTTGLVSNADLDVLRAALNQRTEP